MPISRSSPLPIDALAQDIPRALREHRRLIIEAPTGSGKSTRVPSFLLDSGIAGTGRIVVMQPRRIAARMLSRRVAWERDVPLGGEVGYQVRLENRTSDATRIRFETDGIILRRLIESPRLDGVNVIVFDEFHERHLYGDVMLARALELQKRERPDLMLVVMSATLDGPALQEYLSPCATLRTDGRVHPVRIQYLPRMPHPDRTPVWDVAAGELHALLREEPEGDALIFMPGAYEIRKTIEAIRRLPGAADLTVLPLHGELPPDEQDAAMVRTPRRKVIVATNVAETSLTIDGIRIVVDAGLARTARFDPHRGINTLWIEKISRASADQRAGRAGRTAPGVCRRLWTEADHAARAAQTPPEVRRLELSEILLLLKHSGIADPARLGWLDPPEPRALQRALDLLTDLGALASPDGSVTPLGRRLLSFPLPPRTARMLVAGADLGCMETAALVAAFVQESGLHLPRSGRHVTEKREQRLGEETDSDFRALLRSWRFAEQNRFDFTTCRDLGISESVARRIAQLRKQFLSIASDQGLPGQDTTSDPTALPRCLLTGYADQVARSVNATSRRYELVHQRRATLDRDSVVGTPPLLVATEIHEIQRSDGEVDVRLSQATVIRREWLEELFPGAVTREQTAEFDRVSGRVVAVRQIKYRDLVIESGRGPDPDPGAAAAILAAEVHSGRITLKNWNHAVEQWILRVNLLAQWCPELGLPPVDEAARRTLVEQICSGAKSARDLKDADVWSTVRAWLPPHRTADVERFVPERLALPNQRQPKITYEPNAPPFIAMRIQELYGVNQPLLIAKGRVRVVVKVLAPNGRAVQVTDDLGSFWKNAYPAIKKEYQRKYPKHQWK